MADELAPGQNPAEKDLVDTMLAHLMMATGGDAHITTRVIFEAVAAAVANNVGPCDEVGHNYRPGKTDYYKSFMGKPDQSQSFARLFCSKCANTVEVPWADHRVFGGGLG